MVEWGGQGEWVAGGAGEACASKHRLLHQRAWGQGRLGASTARQSWWTASIGHDGTARQSLRALGLASSSCARAWRLAAARCASKAARARARVRMPFGDFFLECTARPQRRGQGGEAQQGRSALQSPVSRPRRSPGKTSPVATDVARHGGIGLGAGTSSQLAGGACPVRAVASPVRAGMAMVLDTGYLSPPMSTSSVRVNQVALGAGAFQLDS